MGHGLILAVLAIGVSLVTIPVSAEKEIPDWFRNNALFWGQGQISDQEFVSSVEYLIKLGLIDETVTKPASNTDYDNIPEWVKNIALWWAQGNVTYDEFANGLKFMINQEIIGTSLQEPTNLKNSFSIEKLPTEDGLKVTWTPNDSKNHYIASGNIFDGTNGKFESGFLKNIHTFHFFFTEEGTFEYFDLTQPWASGTITVTPSDLEIYLEELEKKRIAEELEAIEKERELQIENEISKIRKKYSQNLSKVLSVSFDKKEYGEFIGEKKLERYRTIVSDIDTRMVSVDFTIFDNLALSTEERILVVEVLQETLEFFKNNIKENLEKVDPLLKETENEINQMDIPDQTKSKHISELQDGTEEKKAVYANSFASAISTIEQELDERRNALSIEAELLGNEDSPDPSICGPGTEMKDGQCVPTSAFGGGCLIATATFGSELAPQVQQLRELRDNHLLKTQSGTFFMTGFNELYYSFSPTIADLERQSPVFKEVVKITITPLITSLSILNYVDMDSEAKVLGYGIGLILLNIGMYFVAPVSIGIVIATFAYTKQSP